jgi:hypothetical protein
MMTSLTDVPMNVLNAPDVESTTSADGYQCLVERKDRVGRAIVWHSKKKYLQSDDIAAVSRTEALCPPVVPGTVRSSDIGAYVRKLKMLRELPAGWNGYGAETPSESAVHWAQRVLETLFDFDIDPVALAPSAEGGVAISFIRGTRAATIECLNDGDVVAVTTDRVAEPRAWDVIGENDIRDTLQRISAFLG